MAYLVSVRGLLQALSVSTDYNRRNLTTLEKKIEDCFFILENADASYIELSVGVGLFEEEKIPGDYIQKVHVYHKYGMEDSVQKMYQQISPEVEKIVLIASDKTEKPKIVDIWTAPNIQRARLIPSLIIQTPPSNPPITAPQRPAFLATKPMVVKLKPRSIRKGV